MSLQATLAPLAQVSRFWCEVKDGDPVGRSLYHRHYSRRHYRDGRKPHLFVGPGEKMVLLTPAGDALFVWRRFISADGQEGVNCAVFRNEGCNRSSELILDAMELAWDRWPGERLYTYVDARKVKSPNPGYCFKKAGWRLCGVTANGKLILDVFFDEARLRSGVARGGRGALHAVSITGAGRVAAERLGIE